MTTQGSTLEFYMLDLINGERAANGLAPLQLEQNLNQAAEDHSLWMIESDIFSHTGAGGSSAKDRMEAADFTFSGSWASGENIGYQSERGAPGLIDDVEDIHDRLMASSGHRWNILNENYDYVGIGIEYGNHGGYDGVMITQNFANTSAPVILDTQGVGSNPPLPPEPPVSEVIRGTSGRDILNGTSGDDAIQARGGKDVVNGGAGADTIEGGSGNDVLRGDGGADTIWGDGGRDWLIGGDGADVLRGGTGADVVDYHGASSGFTADLQYEANNTGAASGDIYISIASLRGSSGDDALRGNSWANQLRGGSGDDTLNGRGGDDDLHGGNGNDVLRGAAGDDNLFGMGGADRFVFEPSMGRDVVHDFDDDLDLLDFSALNLGSLGAVMARASQVGTDVMFDLDGRDAVIVENASLSQLQDDISF
ncbi:CAP domain-containing protein [Roseovarius atlanticus]|uniref:CAP domain-containing protein n=1 Tax=Roseovarius atlanticus TaxID=1641875 RepID=UPI001C95B102|nr:CAP domain-containing protein [Roseovarius atlanticus]MBY6127055.1 hypothetical protein [Roseovarius atlanticus]MBY6151549.1 hypothetical protein [Roseovarius atlanticus]